MNSYAAIIHPLQSMLMMDLKVLYLDLLAINSPQVPSSNLRESRSTFYQMMSDETGFSSPVYNDFILLSHDKKDNSTMPHDRISQQFPLVLFTDTGF